MLNHQSPHLMSDMTIFLCSCDSFICTSWFLFTPLLILCCALRSKLYWVLITKYFH